MKMLVEKLVDGIQKFEVVEAETASQAINQCNRGFSLNQQGEPVFTEEEISYVGAYEVGQINLLDAVEHEMKIHRFYREKVEALGFNPDNFGKL